MKIDHIALSVDNPRQAADWYIENFGADLIYADETWSIIQFENIKLAFVVPNEHPAHFAFEIENANLPEGKLHRDGSKSVYKKDPWGNIFELIQYKNLHTRENDDKKRLDKK